MLVAAAGVQLEEDLLPGELVWMAEAKISDAWDHTAFLLMQQHNLNAKRKKNYWDFHPFKRKKRMEANAGTTLDDFQRILDPTVRKQRKPDEAPGALTRRDRR